MRRRTVQALGAQRRATLDLLRLLSPGEWERPCRPPWRVREVVAHLIVVDEAVMTGRLWRLLRRASHAELERWNDRAVLRLGAASPAELLDHLERSGRRLERVVARLPRALAGVRVRTGFGRQPLRVLVARRILDEWIHTVDVARVVDRSAAVAEGVADALATAVLETLPELVLPRLTVPAGVLRLVVETGAPDDPHAPRRTWSIDCARRQYGPRVSAPPDSTLRLHATTLALLAEGRADPSGGGVVVEGDEALADRLLRHLAPGD